MTQRQEWPKAPAVARRLVSLVDEIVRGELPGALKQHGYWHAGSTAGEKGSSLFVGARGDKAGRWKDGATGDFGDLIDLIAKARGISLSEAYEAACVEYLGFASQRDARKPAVPQPTFPSAVDDGADQAKRVGFARRIWRGAGTIQGTSAATYLTGRRIKCALPPCLRFHSQCPRGRAEYLPAIVALLVDIETNEGCGIHRTYLRAGGLGKVSHGAAKMMLGRSAGACIKLTRDDEVTQGLGICEGIETGLTLVSIGCGPVWAIGSAGGIRTFPVLGGIEALTIFADHDRSGAGVDAAEACARRWSHAGKEVRIVYPKEPGADWNDVARAA